jgi:hypothetical protein
MGQLLEPRPVHSLGGEFPGRDPACHLGAGEVDVRAAPLISEKAAESDGHDLAPGQRRDLSVLIQRVDQVLVEEEADAPAHGRIVPVHR